MKSDSEIKTDVQAELAWDPAVKQPNIGVIVQNGIVTLTGHLNTYAEKWAVERAVRRVEGVRGVAVELDVKLSPSHKRSDTEIAQAAVNALRWNALVPDEKIKVEVEDGWVDLQGEVESFYQSSSAEHAVRPLIGVRGVTNHITIKPRVSTSNVAADISSALVRHAAREAKGISIDVDGSVVTLKGKVDSLADHDAAVGAASSTTGVSRVVDQLVITA